MVDVRYKVRWDKAALNELAKIYAYILEDSYQNVQAVRRKIFELAASLEKDPKRYKPDNLRIDNNMDFRAVEVYRFRITFYVDEENKTVNILRVRSTMQEPLNH